MRSQWYKLVGHNVAPCEELEGARLLENQIAKIVGYNHLRGARVSTCFQGLDLGWGDGPPLVFETMVFDGPLDGEQERYSTWNEAEEGHRLMCERVRNASVPEKENPQAAAK